MLCMIAIRIICHPDTVCCVGHRTSLMELQVCVDFCLETRRVTLNVEIRQDLTSSMCTLQSDFSTFDTKALKLKVLPYG
ncbi:hypothetical protein KP509_14G025200 [Ceratopteris richardii]|uniref:Uncharacterized protein n=1 Tax=Ceratopteris richardii TaxID=49495 RepID=A0A8T2TB14_CERRI|nr:hypothetical protein KP509_14G025200 [Ceratopteris richardii]